MWVPDDSTIGVGLLLHEAVLLHAVSSDLTTSSSLGSGFMSEGGYPTIPPANPGFAFQPAPSQQLPDVVQTTFSRPRVSVDQNMLRLLSEDIQARN